MPSTNCKVIAGVLMGVLMFAGLLSGCQQSSPEVGGNPEVPEIVFAEPTPTIALKPESTEAVSKESEEKPESETWFQVYGGRESDVVNDVLQAEDGGYYILGATNFSWETTQKADIYLIRTDEYGEMMWDKTLTSGGFSLGQSLYFASSGSIMVAGITRADEKNGIDAILLEVDLDGTLLGSQVIGGEMDEWVNMIVEAEDGGFYLFGNIVDPNDFVTDPGAAGYGGFENRSSIYIVRLDKDGEVVWTRNLDNGKNVMAGGAAPTADGGFYILATVLNYPEMGDDLLLVKIDGEGNEVSTRLWDEGGIVPRAGQVTPGGNLLIGAIYSASGDARQGDADYLIMELDPDGNEIWRTIFGTPGEVDALCGIIETEDEGYLLVGDRSRDLYSSDSDLVLIKLDSRREVVWEKVLDTKPHFMIRTLASTKGGYIIAASFFRSHGSPSDILLIKTDLNGDIEN